MSVLFYLQTASCKYFPGRYFAGSFDQNHNRHQSIFSEKKFNMRLEDFDVRKKISKGAFGDGRSKLIIDFDLDFFEFTWQSTMESTLR